MSKKVVIIFNPLSNPKGSDLFYPWNILYLERAIRDLDVEVILIDERLERNYVEIVKNKSNDLLFAGVSAIAGYQVTSGIKFAEAVKSIKKVPVIWGGWFSTVFPEMVLNDDLGDYVCIGQGEMPFRMFTQGMLFGKDVTEIKGIGFKKNGEIIINRNFGLTSTDTLPGLDLTLIDVNRMIDLNGKVQQGSRGIDYLASIGCPNHCTFCNLATAYEGKWFTKKYSDIIDDLKFLYEKAGVTYIVFGDNNLFANKKFVLELSRAIIESKLPITWDAQAHVDYFINNFSDEDIRLLYKAGCRRIKFGAESGDQEVINLVNKGLKVENNLKIVSLLKRYNIRTRLHTMLCFPLNPEKDFWITLNMIGKAILIDPKIELDVAFYKPFPQTPLYDMSVEKGFVFPTNTKDLVDYIYNKTNAPWYNKDFYKLLNNFVFFYFLWANPYHYRTFKWKIRPVAFIVNILLYPLIFLRFKFNLMKFPLEAKILRKIIYSKKEYPFFFSISINKSRYLIH